MTNENDNLHPIRVGISMCLLGEKVRYDGGHKHDRYLTDIIGRYVKWVPVCPEVEIGLGTPRESIRLIQQGEDILFIMPKSGTDHTEKMREYALRRVNELAEADLCGYILKKGSPSCGMERVRIYQNSGMPTRNGRGLFADALIKHLPHLPVEEEGRLSDPKLRENFISHVFAYHRWRQIEVGGITRKALTRFHQQHKFVLMAHNQAGTRRLGQIVGEFRQFGTTQKQANAYLDEFTTVMRRPPTLKGHTNVLQHMAGYFSKELDRDDRAELTEMIHQYRNGVLPLIVPITLLRHYARKFRVQYLEDQVYLNPHPHELMLLNPL